MINISKISKNYGSRTLFKDLSLRINKNEKIGLLGPNGAGKSTLFAMILGECEPSSGNVSVEKHIRIGYLPQEASFNSQQTVLMELIHGDAEINRLNNEKQELEQNHLADSKRYGHILDRLDALGFFQLEYKAKKILTGLGFKQSDLNRPIRQLSGGWQMRTLLARLLTCHYDILLLDEPTNYLDLNAALWFKDFLKDFKGTFIIISHDKSFLNETTNYTLILEHSSVFKVHGNYKHYETIKAEKLRFLTKQYNEQEKKRKQLERFIARFRGQPNKAAQVRAKKTALERIEKIALPPGIRASIKDFHFPQTKRGGYKTITLENICKSYGDIQVYKNLDFEIYRQEKAVLAGENGAGKSTLLKILAGVIESDSGTRSIGYNTETGYFSQTRLDVLNPDNTVLQEVYSAAPGYAAEAAIRTILGAFLFTGDDADKKVKVLSGGEKSRLILAKLLINPPNFLLLDEPTTHLDVDATEALVKALQQYEGTIIFISHDIYFVRSLANVVFAVDKGRIKKIPGNFDYYLEKKARGEIVIHEHGPTQEKAQKPKQISPERATLQAEQKQRKEEKKRKHKHNQEIKKQIQKLKHQKEKLHLEKYAKSRVLEGPHIHIRSEASIAIYQERIEEIRKLISQMEEESKNLESGLL